ncbi:aryl-sulfate sulfotransferase [Halosimplex aquaticum]|uniref:Aryl-sulfate sulfotransferase n=1 Tax=Halosimplex aquaticum TaxID=3026162 RepID=A0ABD5XZC8_9EURY|nr:aryl-sulfate sulfotransferase [Halosimplex aquaticum]
MTIDRGTALALVGAGLLLVTLSAGAVTAPDREITTGDESETLVGVQGGWVTGGNVRFYAGSDEVWRESSADGYFEVSRLPDGTVLAAFANESSTECGDLESPCARTGFRHIDPSGSSGPQVISEYSFPVASLTNSEVHGVDRIDNGTYAFTDMDAERIAIVDNGTQVWEWRASSFYDAPDDPTSRDWLHINDVDAIDENRFLVSVRNANQLVVVERGQGVVEVINEDDGGSDESCTKDGELSDFDGDEDVRCGDPAVLNHQHNPQWLGSDAVLVADSENDRVVELQQTENKSWEPVWVVRKTAENPLDWPRDADRLPDGNTLITDSLNKRVVEVDETGQAVWGIGTESDIPYEADRLPVGEYAGGFNTTNVSDSDRRVPIANATGQINEADTGSDIPVLTVAITGIRGAVGVVPYWFAELHLAATLVSLGLVIGGGIDRWRTRD